MRLIPESAHKEIHLFYDSPTEWTRGYLTESGGVPPSIEMDKKGQERMYKCKTTDPYGLTKASFPRILLDKENGIGYQGVLHGALTIFVPFWRYDHVHANNQPVMSKGMEKGESTAC